MPTLTASLFFENKIPEHFHLQKRFGPIYLPKLKRYDRDIGHIDDLTAAVYSVQNDSDNKINKR